MKHRATAIQYLLAAWVIAVSAVLVPVPVLSDEVFSLALSRLGWGEMTRQLAADVHPPLYYWLLHLWWAVAPETLTGLRLFSALGTSISIVLVWRFLQGRYEVDTAWVGLGLWVANPLLLLMTGYGRMYTLLALLCLAALWVALEGKGRWRQAGLAVLCCAGLLTHNWFVFFLIALAVAVRFEVRTVAPLAAGCGLYGLVWGRQAWAQLQARAPHLAWLKEPEWYAPLETLMAHLWLALLVSPLLLAIVAVRKRQPHRVEWSALAGLAAALLVPFAISFQKPVYNTRFTVIAAPFLVWALAPWMKGAGRWGAAVLVVAGLACLGYQLKDVPKANSRDAAQLLRAKMKAEDTAVFCRLTRQPVEFYWKPARAVSFPAEIDAHPGYEGLAKMVELQAEARALAGRPGRLFVLADPSKEASAALIEVLSRERGRPEVLVDSGAATKHYFSQLLVFPARP